MEQLEFYRLLQILSFVRAYSDSELLVDLNLNKLYITVEFYLADFMKIVGATQNTYQREQFFDKLMRLPPYNQKFSLGNSYSSQL